MSKSKIALIVLATVIGVGIITFIAINNQIAEKDRSARDDKLIEESKKRAEEVLTNDKNILEQYNGNYEESNLTENDIDLTQVYSREDIMNHAKLLLGVISDETKEKAMSDLPLTPEATSKHFSNSKNVYYGSYTSDVSVTIKFAGLNYSSSENNYSANVIAEVTYYNSEGDTDIRMVNLVIEYEKLKISNWSY